MTVAELTIPNGWDEITPAWMYRASVAHGLAIWIATLSGGDAWQRPEICLAFAVVEALCADRVWRHDEVEQHAPYDGDSASDEVHIPPWRK